MPWSRTYHTTVTDKTEQVKTTIRLLCVLEALLDVLDLVQFLVLDGLVDADHVLPDDTTGANVQVTDFTVAHEAFGQADGEGGCLELGVALSDLGALFRKLVHPWCFGVQDGITLGW